MPGPDFPTGGEILYDRKAMEQVYESGRGSITLRAKWRYLQKENLIEITEIPYTTTCEAILDKVAELIKAGKVREINDMRDETDLSGLRLAIDLKRGTDPDKLMQKLFRSTTLQDSFPCNFNILIAGYPRVMGVREILNEWIAWRTECVRRRIFHELSGKREKLHLLHGLEKILLDIDRAIEIIRNTELEEDVGLGLAFLVRIGGNDLRQDAVAVELARFCWHRLGDKAVLLRLVVVHDAPFTVLNIFRGKHFPSEDSFKGFSVFILVLISFY